jgi:hypothetical protein
MYLDKEIFMSGLILGLAGKAGVGKDTAADVLRYRHDFAVVALADPIKRAAASWFGWDEETLWGPSRNRNAPYAEYGGLTPRRALQFIGTEVGRELYEDIWVKCAFRAANALLDPSGEFRCRYDKVHGLFPISWSEGPPAGVVISDVRFPNEVEAIKKAGGRVVLIRRVAAGLDGSAGQHESEISLEGMPHELFDDVVDNEGSLESFKQEVCLRYGGKWSQWNSSCLL